MVDNIGMNHRGAGSNGNVRKFDDVRDPVRCDSYFAVGERHKVRLGKGE
jgi:hypothetical protein